MTTKITDKQYYMFIFLSIAITVLFFAYQDNLAVKMWNTTGGPGPNNEAFNRMAPLFLDQWYNFTWLITIGVALIYYFFRRDISESIAVFLGSWIMFYFGAGDVAFYWIKGNFALDASMPWLFNNNIVGWVSKNLFKLETVTPIALYCTVIIGVAITWFVVKFLRGKNTFLGVKI